MEKESQKNSIFERAAFVRICMLALLAFGSAALCGCGSESRWKSQSFAFSLAPDSPASGTRTNILALRRVTISPLFQGRSFTYRTTEDTYEHDPYATFFVPPERALEQPIYAGLRAGGAFGSVIGPSSGLSPSLVAEVTVSQLYGDFREKTQPAGVMAVHFVLYAYGRDGGGQVLMDKEFDRRKPMARATPAALMAAWDADIREIMGEINSELKALPLN